MKLSFQCQQDPKQMPTKNGTKFCEHCKKQVHDIRRKSQEKVKAFYQNNPNACVIAYEDQIDKLPKLKIVSKPSSYVPYAASVIAVVLLPSLTMAQMNGSSDIQTIGVTPVPVLNTNSINPTEEIFKDVKVSEHYFIDGKVVITDKKLKTRNVKEIIIYKIVRDANGEYVGEDTLAFGTLQLNGKFKLEITKSTFDLLKIENEDIWFSVDGFSSETLEELTFDKNIANATISVSARRRVMGALF